jgi:hypothetical protein
LTGELASVVTEQHLRHATVYLQLVQCPHNIVAFQALSYFDRYSFSRMHIHDRQGAKPRSILQQIHHENLGTAPQFGQAVQGQQATTVEGTVLNIVNWGCNVIAPVIAVACLRQFASRTIGLKDQLLTGVFVYHIATYLLHATSSR